MPRFIDYHDDLKLPAEAIAQIAEDTRNAKADQFRRPPDRALPQTRKARRSACSTVRMPMRSGNTTRR